MPGNAGKHVKLNFPSDKLQVLDIRHLGGWYEAAPMSALAGEGNAH